MPGILVSQVPGILVSQVLVSQVPGILVSQVPGILVSQGPGILISQVLGIIILHTFLRCQTSLSSTLLTGPRHQLCLPHFSQVLGINLSQVLGINVYSFLISHTVLTVDKLFLTHTITAILASQPLLIWAYLEVDPVCGRDVVCYSGINMISSVVCSRNGYTKVQGCLTGHAAASVSRAVQGQRCQQHQ
jgi:hypothetical protein